MSTRVRVAALIAVFALVTAACGSRLSPQQRNEGIRLLAGFAQKNTTVSRHLAEKRLLDFGRHYGVEMVGDAGDNHVEARPFGGSSLDKRLQPGGQRGRRILFAVLATARR